MENISHPTGMLRKAIELAKTASELSDYTPFKLGAVIFDHHKIYCYGYNKVKSNPLQRYYNKYKCVDAVNWRNHGCHAEMSCIHTLTQEYYSNFPATSKLSIFIFRQNSNGEYRLAQPCKACEMALKRIGIKNIYYTGNNSIIYERYN